MEIRKETVLSLRIIKMSIRLFERRKPLRSKEKEVKY